MSKHLGADGELSLRHLPDLSDDSFSFQIPAVSKRDLLLADNGDDFLKNAVDDSFMLPGPSRRPRPTQSSPSPPPTHTALTLNDLTPKPKSTRALVSRLKVSSVPTETSMPEQEPPEWDTPSEAPLAVTPRTKAKRTLSQHQSKQRTPHGIARAAKPQIVTRPVTVKSKSTRLLAEDDEGDRHVEASPAIARLRALKADVEMLNNDVDIDIGVGNDDNDVPCSLPNTLPREVTVPSRLGSTINVDNVRSDAASRGTNGTSVPFKPSFLTQVAISNTGTSEPCAAITSSVTLPLPISTPPDPCDDLHNGISAPTFRQQHSRALELEPTNCTHATPASSENAELINGQDSLDVSICSTTSGGVAERLVMYGQKMLMDSFIAFPAPGVGKIKQSSQNVNPDIQSASSLDAAIHNSKRNPGTRSPTDGQGRDNDDTFDKSQPFRLSQLSPHKQVKPVMASLSTATTASGTTSSNNNTNTSIPSREGMRDPLLLNTAYREPSGSNTGETPDAVSDLSKRTSTKRPVSAAARLWNADGQSKYSSSFNALSAKDDPRPAKRLRAHPGPTDAVRIGDNDWKDDNGVSRHPGAAGRQNSARSSSKSVQNEEKGKATRTTRLAESSISAESKSAGAAKTRAKPGSKKQARTNAAGSVASSPTSSSVGSRLRSGSGSGSGAGSGSGTITRVRAGAGTRPERVAIFMSSSGKSDPGDVAPKGEGHRNIFGGRTTQTELHRTDEKLASEDAHSDQVQANSDRSRAADADHDKADGRDKWELVPGPCLGSSPVSADEGGSGSPVDGVRCAHDDRALKDAGSTPACGHVSVGVAGDLDPVSGTRAELGGPVGIESRGRSGPGSSTSPSVGPRIDKTETVDAVGKLTMPSFGTNTEGRKELRGIRGTHRPEEGKKQRSHPHPAVVVENGTANQVASARSLRAMKNAPLETGAKPRAPNRLEHSQSHKRTLSSSSSSQGRARRQRGRDHHTNAPESAQSAGPARSTSSSDATATKPVGFKFELDARMEARKVEFEKRKQERERKRQQERGTATLAKSYPIPDWKLTPSALGASLPAFASSSSYASTMRGSGKENARSGVVPAASGVSVTLHTELRMRERRKFDEHVREREQEMERMREEQRREREREEEREMREMRRRAVPRAHEVPEWYRDAPRRTRSASGSGEALDG